MQYFRSEFMAQIYFEIIENSITAPSFNLIFEKLIIIMKILPFKRLKFVNFAINYKVSYTPLTAEFQFGNI